MVSHQKEGSSACFPEDSLVAWDAAEDGEHAGASRGCVLAETCIASAAFVDGIQEKALAEARTAAEEAIKQRKASQAAARTPSEGDHVLSNMLFGAHTCHHSSLAGSRHGRHMAHVSKNVASFHSPSAALDASGMLRRASSHRGLPGKTDCPWIPIRNQFCNNQVQRRAVQRRRQPLRQTMAIVMRTGAGVARRPRAKRVVKRRNR